MVCGMTTEMAFWEPLATKGPSETGRKAEAVGDSFWSALEMTLVTEETNGSLSAEDELEMSVWLAEKDGCWCCAMVVRLREETGLLARVEPPSGENAVMRVSGDPSFLWDSPPPLEERGEGGLNFSMTNRLSEDL